MTALREAAQQALEVLTANQYAVANQAPHSDVMAYNATIDALRAALAQPQIDPVDEYRKGFIAGQIDMRDREQPAPEPVAWIRPSGREMLASGGHCTVYASEGMSNHSMPLYTAPPRCPNCDSLEAQNNDLDRKLAEMERAEPVAWRFQSAVGGWAYGSTPPIGSKYPAYPLYAAPPQCKPLTHSEISRLWKYHTSDHGSHFSPYDDDGLGFTRAIEQAHGIKE